MKQMQAGLDTIDSVIDTLLELIQEGVVILRGDLAAGKTTFVKHLAKRLGVSEEVTSPTFSLQHCYGEKLYHYDIYNHGLEHFLSLGLLEEFEKEGLHCVEWGDESLQKILDEAGIETVVVSIEKIDTDKREYRFEKIG